MRGGLDDALDKLARRDALRRRASGESPGTPPAVTELVEAIAAVVSRNPKLEVTVGVEGVGDPLLLHFAMEDGVVQVTADNTVAARASDAEPATPRHADFDIDLDEPPFVPTATAPTPTYETRPDASQDTRRISYDDRNRFDPGTGYPAPSDSSHSEAFFTDSPSQSYEPERNYQDQSYSYSEAAEQRAAQQRAAQHGMPEPLPEPVPLRIDAEATEAATEAATRRLAALLRDNPTLLSQSPQQD